VTSPLTTTGGRLAVPVNDRDHTLGPSNAPVTVVEYGDYQCPYCGLAYPITQELLRLRANRVRFVFRHFPLTHVHPYAELAAEAAESAGARGRFWQMHGWLFVNQDRISPATVIAALLDVGVDGAAVVEDIREHRYLDKVRSDFIGGVHSGVNGTPAFFINGIRHVGGYSLPELTAVVDRAAV
jgi:protein-disulfide isomerase